MASSHSKDAELLADPKEINQILDEAFLENFGQMIDEAFDGEFDEAIKAEADARWEYEKTLTDPETKRRYEKALADLDDEGKPWQ